MYKQLKLYIEYEHLQILQLQLYPKINPINRSVAQYSMVIISDIQHTQQITNMEVFV